MNSELEQESVLETELEGLQTSTINDHSTLNNLDYEHSGHIGFAPAGDYVEDSNYIHTDNNYTDEEKTKLAGLSNYDDTEIKGDISDLETNKANKNEIPDVSNFITKNVNDLTYYTLSTGTGSAIEVSINSSTYVVTVNLKNKAGTVISTDTIDLPLESVVVNGSYDSTNKKIVLTLQNGNTIDIPVGDLINGLQSEITSNNKLSSDLVDDTNKTNKFVTSAEKTAWNGKQDLLVSGTNIKTINNNSILGSGNINISGGMDILKIYDNSTQEEKNTMYQQLIDNYIANKDTIVIKYYNNSISRDSVILNMRVGETSLDSSGNGTITYCGYIINNAYGNYQYGLSWTPYHKVQYYIVVADNTLSFALEEDSGHAYLLAPISWPLGIYNSDYYVPSSDYNPSTKLYTDKTHYENMTGYDSSKTQILKNIQGTLTWVDE